ncbi:efflux transporter outer membrane subunit [Noviherbaspirillum sp.]|uniref:efflux transporter outer membrane subunit n=1 Tax=Noviherbaspirillum sp. TaxID=1926288 RepID=UPI0039C93840
MTPRRRLAIAILPLLLAACAAPRPPAATAPAVPAQWQAPLPHNGSTADLAQWWQAQGDALLAQLVDAAQAASPTLAAARSRMEQARAVRVAAGAALAPALNAAVSSSRSSAQPPLPLGTTSQAALQAAWEIDVFGGARADRDAAQAQLESATASWHAARVSVAAEVANQYYALRACEQLLLIAQSDAASRAETSRLAELSANAGFQAPAVAALASASAAEGRARVTQQRAQCELERKTLVALTALPEEDLRQKLAAPPQSPGTPQEAQMNIASLPAQLLAQRPDVYAAERDLAAASAAVGGAYADRFPRLTLSGSVGRANFRAAGASTDLSTWSVGPLAVTVPVFDAGRISAGIDAATARYEEAAALYRARVRQAVREVEEALVSLQSTATRRDDVRIAVEGYRASFDATEARYKGGLASLVELEEARRTRLAAENALVLLERERRAAWIGLYRAAGGGWRRDAAGGPGGT